MQSSPAPVSCGVQSVSRDCVAQASNVMGEEGQMLREANGGVCAWVKERS